MARLTWFVSAPLLLAMIGGCSTYVSRYDFAPRPAFAEIRSNFPDQPATPVMAVASVIGVRRASSDENLPASVEVRLRVDNNGTKPVTFDPQSMELIDGQLLKFPPPLVRPSQPVVLNPKLSEVVTAYFPF